MSSRRISWKAKLALITFGLVVSLGICEIVLRIFPVRGRGTEFANLDEVRRAMLKPSLDDQGSENSGNSLEGGNLRGLVAPHADDKIIFDLIPNLNIIFQRAPVTTNSCGMRDVERKFYKDPNTFRIALLGDSFVFGWGVKQNESFAKVLEDTLNKISQGKPKFEVLNFGVPGYSTFQEVAKFKELGVDFDPDAVLVFFIENDFGLPFYVRDIYNPGSILSAVSFARLTWQAIDPKLEQQKLQMTGYDPNRALLELSELCKSKGIPLYLTINPKKNSKSLKSQLWVLRHNPYIQYIDMRESFKKLIANTKIPEADLTLSFDPHPSPLRHKIYGTILAASFLKWIRK